MNHPQITLDSLVARLRCSRDGFLYIGDPLDPTRERDEAITLHVVAGTISGTKKEALIGEVMRATDLGRRQVFNILDKTSPRLSYGIGVKDGTLMLIEPEFAAPIPSGPPCPARASGSGIEW